jgi:hypothetical protein
MPFAFPPESVFAFAGILTQEGIVEWVTQESLLSTEFRAFPYKEP